MKKLIAKRKLQRKCDNCDREILKGEAYYKQREVDIDYETDEIYAFNWYYCPKCVWKMKRHNERYSVFADKCTHPDKFIDTQYSYILGEAVMEPSHAECRLCGKVV